MMLFDHGSSPSPLPPTPPTPTPPMEGTPAMAADAAADHLRRKRKADTQETSNERLSKRLSLLNLEHGGTRLYVPVEDPSARPTPPNAYPPNAIAPAPAPAPAAAPAAALPPPRQPPAEPPADGSMMQLDDTKYKVYIYNIDDELSSSDDDGDDDDDDDDDDDPGDAAGRLVFLPDIEKHLRARRRIPGVPPPGPGPIPIPRPVPPSPEGELAGMQLVLYGVPSSLTVPEEQDSVRKAIIEARQRHRERQQQGQGRPPAVGAQPPALAGSEPVPLGTIPEAPKGPVAGGDYGYLDANAWAGPAQQAGEDADAMDID